MIDHLSLNSQQSFNPTALATQLKGVSFFYSQKGINNGCFHKNHQALSILLDLILFCEVHHNKSINLFN